MPKVSRIPLDPKKTHALHDAFCRALGSLHSRAEVEEFVHGILTATERKMLAKRLAAARMLLAGASYAEIRREIGITNTTIAHAQTFLQSRGEGLQRLLKKLINTQ